MSTFLPCGFQISLFKFQAIAIGNKDKYIEKIEINNEFKITVDSDLTLLGVEIDENLRLDIHIDKICKKAAKQLNSLKRIARHMGEKEKNYKFFNNMSL